MRSCRRSSPSKNLITDLQYHGTHVAATVVSNGIVGAGVTSKTKLMGVKVCRVDRSCSFGAIISGVLYAADNGADVANLSLGGSFPKDAFGRFCWLHQQDVQLRQLEEDDRRSLRR